MNILPVILCGGSGTRLWPASRSDYPKQLQKLIGNATLLQQTAQRLPSAGEILPPLILSAENQRFLVAEQLRAADICTSGIILEPLPRSTAPALTIAALWVKRPADTVLVVMPADHYIPDRAAFAEAVQKAAAHAMSGKLMTLGVKPTQPHTGFGYIEQGIPLSDDAFVAKQFKEKPDKVTAKAYIDQGTFLWNAGIFIFRADMFLNQIRTFCPGILSACTEALAQSENDLDFLRLDRDAFSKAEDISVDYAIMERADNVGVLPVSFVWSDIGDWPALWDIGEKDAAGNVVEGDVMVKDSERCYIRSGKHLVAALGLKDTVIVETPDALLVAAKDKAAQVKDFVAKLKKEGRSEHKEHVQVWRPWGSYESLAKGPRFQVKKIVVKPNGKLSLQKHHHRAEHWIVVEGTAKVQVGDKVLLLGPDESTYIPLGEVHRLENPGRVPLFLIEVQSGDYLGEDDIVRLEDIYSRT